MICYGVHNKRAHGFSMTSSRSAMADSVGADDGSERGDEKRRAPGTYEPLNVEIAVKDRQRPDELRRVRVSSGSAPWSDPFSLSWADPVNHSNLMTKE